MAQRGDGDAFAATVVVGPDGGGEELAGSAVVAGRYEIVGLIGRGGMGTVYRARDRELDEVVALKVLKPELAGAPGMLDRFRREVKLSRRVTHRNVARMFDIGDAGGTRFLTMELVEGESLADRLSRTGRLPTAETLAVARDVCAGLAAAHDAGVLHRDLKPDNVILAKDGRAVITDFGIARAVMASDARTAVGTFIGTPLYMAPEQVEGLVEPDARADLYALGVMLYELLTGRAAWERDSAIAIAAARLLEPPPDPRTIAPYVSDAVAAFVQRLMARRREDRPASAAQTLGELDAVAAAATAPKVPSAAPSAPSVTPSAKKRIAVLPLVNAGAESDAYLAFGITQDLVDLLSMVEGLAVRPNGRARAMDAREAGRVLEVDVVVEGSLRRERDLVVVTLRAVSVADGFQLWTARFEHPESEVTTVANEAAQAIAKALTTRLAPPDRNTVSSPRAQELYMKGRYLVHHGFGPAFRHESVDMLREAHALDPGSARIAGMLAVALVRAYRSGHTAAALADEARTVARHALELDATRPEPRIALGNLELAHGDGENAAKELASALRVAHTSVDALDAMGRLLVEAGRPEEGLRLLEIVQAEEDIDLARAAIGRTRALLGDWDGADAVLRVPERGNPSALGWALSKARIVAWSRDRERAAIYAKQVAELGLPEAATMLATVLVSIANGGPSGDPAGVRKAFEEIQKKMPSHTPRGISFREQLLAEGMLSAGALDEAAAAIRRASAAKLFDVVWLDHCPLLEPLRREPVFAELRAPIAARGAAIVAAYDRARISMLVRGRRR